MNYKQARGRAERLEQVIQMLSEREMTRCEIAALTGWAHSTVSQYIGWLQDRKRIYVSSWQETKFKDSPRFSVGNFPDVPKRVRELEKEDKRPPTVVNVHRMPLVAALFGEYRRAA